MANRFTPSIRHVAPGALSALPQLLASQMPGASYLAVADSNTYDAAARALEAALPGALHWRILPGTAVKPSLALAQQLAAEASGHDGLLAVGAGTINDLTKCAAYRAGKPYIAIATAASMNGYSSASASLLDAQLKQSFPARPPVAVVADSTLIAAAPRRLAKAGLGDTLARSSVESDALLSHILFGTDYPEALFAKLRTHEQALIYDIAAFQNGAPSYFTTLMHALLDAGDAMAETGSSAIASQSEHMLVHTAELMYGNVLGDWLHGELVALATLTTTRLQEKMLLTAPELKPLYADEALFTRQFGSVLGQALQAQYHRKSLAAEAIAPLQALLKKDWEAIKQHLTAIQQPAALLDRLYRQIGLPTGPTDIGLDDARWHAVLTYAHYTRDRFTFLDLAALAGKRPS